MKRECRGRERQKSESTVDDAFVVVAAVSIATRRVLPLYRFSRARFLTEGLRRLVRMPPRKRRGAEDEVSEEKERRRERQKRNRLLFRRGKKHKQTQPRPKKKNSFTTREQQQQPAATATGTEDSLCRAVKRLATSESQGALPDGLGGEEGVGGQQAGAPEVRRRTSRGQQQEQKLQQQAEAEAEAPPPPAGAVAATTTTINNNAFDEDYEANNQLLRRMHFERMSRLQREKEEREKRNMTNE